MKCKDLLNFLGKNMEIFREKLDEKATAWDCLL